MLISFAAPFCRAADADEQAIRKAVLEVHDRMNKAIQALDVEKMFEFIREAGPGTIIDDGVSRSRQEALATVKRGYQAISRADRIYTRVGVTVLSPTVAVLTGEGSAYFVMTTGRAFSVPFALSEVFVLANGEWKVVQGHHSMPNPQP